MKKRYILDLIVLLCYLPSVADAVKGNPSSLSIMFMYLVLIITTVRVWIVEE